LDSSFFNPEVPEDILTKIIESQKSNDIEEAEKAYKNVLKMKNWRQTTEIIMDVIQKLN